MTTALPAAARPMAKLSLKWNMIEEPTLTVLEKFQLIADLGFDGVELDSPDTLALADIVAARDKTGLAIPGVINAAHWKFPLTDADPAVRQACVDASIKALDDAREYGADTVLLVPGVVNAQTSYKQAWERASAEIPKILAHAEKTGVKLAFENVWNDFLLSPLEAALFVDQFAHASAGWYFDVGNVLRYGRPTHWIEALGPRILKVDLKEYSWTKMHAEGPRAGFDVALGDGDCDWPAVNRALADVGYSGWASVEVPGGDRTRLAEIKRRVDLIAAA